MEVDLQLVVEQQVFGVGRRLLVYHCLVDGWQVEVDLQVVGEEQGFGVGLRLFVYLRPNADQWMVVKLQLSG